jgi:hypothetical protein
VLPPIQLLVRAWTGTLPGRHLSFRLTGVLGRHLRLRLRASPGRSLLVAGFALLVVAESLLSSREDDTRSWGNFLVYFSHKLIQCHANLRGWGYIFIGC